MADEVKVEGQGGQGGGQPSAKGGQGNKKGSGKTLNNTNPSQTKKQVSDVEVWGDGDLFKLVSKASSKKEGWMKSTKACDVGSGCIVQVTTQQGSSIAEALTFVPGVKLIDTVDENGNVVGRKIGF